MIRYHLRCAQGHDFDSWFAGAAAFDRLVEGGHVTCATCGSAEVVKALMAPAVATRKDARPAAADAPLSSPQSAREAAIAELRAAVEARSDYVGPAFAAEARRMHAGDVPERAIHGEARIEEARALLEDGIPVMPLPFAPLRKTN